MIDWQQQISDTAVALGADPALVLATAKIESGFNPSAVGDNGCSYGVFQENICGGAGTGKPIAQLQDVPSSIARYIDRVRRVVAAGFSGSPGEIAAAAQRPADPVGYARKVDALYPAFATPTGGVGGRTPPSTGGGTARIIPGSSGGSSATVSGPAPSPDPATGSCPPGWTQRSIFGFSYCVPFDEGKGPVGPIDTAVSSTIPEAIGKLQQGAITLVSGVAVIGVIAVLGYAGVKRLTV